MYAQRKAPVLVAAFVAVAGTAGILFSDFGPETASQDSGNARMITAAAVAKTGAIEVLSAPPAGRFACASDPVLPGDDWLPLGSTPNRCNALFPP
jgi:TPP-dependent trihydroxycyclohexane-1,2-dione (THcHDO) dehydratase